MDIIQKSGAWFSYNGERLGQGRDNVRRYMEENHDFCDEIEAKVREKLKNGVKPVVEIDENKK